MALGDIFKSKSEREKEQAKRRRKAFREAENSVDAVKDRIGKLKKERDAAWGEARGYLKDGQKAAANRCLQTCRASEMLMSKLEMKRWVFEQLLTKLELAKTDQEFTNALGAINTVVKIDPEQVADVLGEVEDKLGDQIDTDKIWEKMCGKDMEGVNTEMTDVIPSIEEMQKQLQDEVAEEIGGAVSVEPERERETGSSAEHKISEGRRRLRDLMEGEK